MNTPTFNLAPRRVRRKRHSAQSAAAPTVPLTLVAAVYIFEYQFVELEFDRDIDIAGFDGSQVQVFDGYFAETNYTGGVPTLVAPARVRIALVVAGEWVDPDVKLTASVANGIVAVDDGGTWAGVTDLVLPFP